MQRVLAHVDAHVGEPLTVETLGSVAGMSAFHFHRQFTGLFGISVHRYVSLVRLERAAYRLAYRADLPILEIALDAGYESPEAFTRAFKQRVGQSPSAFRKAPAWEAFEVANAPIGGVRRSDAVRARPEVKVRDTADVPVAVMEHRGDPARLGDTLRAFIAWRRAARLPPTVSATFNILYDDPETTPPHLFRLDLCASTPKPVDVPGVVNKVIPGGRCAVLRHVGPEEGFGHALRYLYCDWLAASSESLRQYPLYCQRISFFPDVTASEAVTDFFLPLETP